MENKISLNIRGAEIIHFQVGRWIFKIEILL